MFVEGDENVRIVKGKYETINFASPELFVLHPGWNNLDMNGEFKDGFAINAMFDIVNVQSITQIDFSKFAGQELNTCSFNDTGY